MTDGLLYGSETFMFANLIRVIGLGIGCLFFGFGTYFLIESSEWFGISILIVGVFYALYLIYLWTYNNMSKRLFGEFNDRLAR
jgi:hypothetical protein